MHLTFDVEVWCGGWQDLDARFPAAFERYFLGRSRHGDYAVPKCLEILGRHGLVGVHFVEPLFAARFGESWLERIVDALLQAGQDVQLHLHPEWADEIRPPPIPEVARKRAQLSAYTLAEQTALLRLGKGLLEAAKRAPVSAFRAGGYAVNRDTYTALAALGVRVDSSLNAVYDHTGGSIDRQGGRFATQSLDGVQVFPVTVARDGLGRLRPAQLNAMGFGEMKSMLLQAHASGVDRLVFVSHNFELLRPGSSEPDWTVVRRFEQLCRYLRERDDLFDVGPFPVPTVPASVPPPSLQLGFLPTAVRIVEQGLRRFQS